MSLRWVTLRCIARHSVAISSRFQIHSSTSMITGIQLTRLTQKRGYLGLQRENAALSCPPGSTYVDEVQSCLHADNNLVSFALADKVNIYIGIFGEFDANDFRFAFTKVLGECPDFRSLPPNAHGTMTADNEAAREESAVPVTSSFCAFPDSAANDLTPRPIPEGFTLGPLRAEDVDFVLHHWPYAASDEAEALNAALIDKRTNLPACFLFLEHNGMLTSMYTVEQYRGRKFQDIVFTDVLAQCHSMGVHPWLGISPSNKPLLTMTPDVMKVRTPTGGHQKRSCFSRNLDLLI
ncbi:unnamed protein product, partial [Mesorhabditis belari]|uniref:Glycine N-acyltransferase-like protein n=1 Tax=Mesorhabditis belari TaxID=2138241 RepID=A0AAF3EUK7_9BILA